MKNMVRVVLVVSLAVIFASCGAAREQTRTQSLSEREGVFEEIATAEGPPAGFADVVIKASLKTHLPGEGLLLESRNCPHGQPAYRFILNIDGQAVTWDAPGQREKTPVAGDQHSPDEGDGMRYRLEKRIRLRAGTHRIYLAASETNLTKTVTVNLQEGKSYTLEFQPIYPRYAKMGHPAFRLGFLGFNASIDNTPID